MTMPPNALVSEAGTDRNIKPKSPNRGSGKSIAVNTLMLYFRMFLLLGISLFTARLVLQALGVENFGILSVVGSVVVLFSFVNNALTEGTNRFINVELGRADGEPGRVFSGCINIHIGISLLLIALAETVGLWIINTRLRIPVERMAAANWTFQLAVLAYCVQIMRAPCNALIVAHEDMGFFAAVSVLDGMLKLAYVGLLLLCGGDKLILYSALSLGAALLVLAATWGFCAVKYPDVRYHRGSARGRYREMLSFSTWNLLEQFTAICVVQGTNLLLNRFYGVALNAAAGIAMQAGDKIGVFRGNFQTALNPQLMKSCASGDRERFFQLTASGAKCSFFLMLFITLPVLLNLSFLLDVWLDVVPAHTVEIARILLICYLIEAATAPFMFSIQAVGRIRGYQLAIGAQVLPALALIWVLLRLGFSPETAFLVRLGLGLSTGIIRLGFLRHLAGFPAWRFGGVVLGRLLPVTLLVLPLPLWLRGFGGWRGLLTSGAASALLVPAAIWLVGLSSAERESAGAALAAIRKRFIPRT